MNLSISLIIAFYNNIEWLEMIFEQLKKQSFKSFEVVIADDGSKQEVVDRIKELTKEMPFQIKHIWHEDLGWRKDIILNKAVVASSADYLVFIDGDCIPHHKFLEEHWRFKEENFVIGGRRVHLTKEISQSLTPENVKDGILSRITLKLLWAGITKKERHTENVIRITPQWLRNLLLKERIGGLLGCNFGMFKKDLLKVNGFDERYLAPAIGEDTDLEARLKRIGIKVRVCKHAVTVFHKNHKREEIPNNNGEILQYNKEHNISYTPWGINQEQEKNIRR